MQIAKIELSNFRGLEHKELTFDKQFNVIIGVNGIGKTSVLDSISVLLTRILPRTTPSKAVSRQFIKNDLRYNSTGLAARLWLRFGGLTLDYSLAQGFGEQSTLTENADLRTLRHIYEQHDSENITSLVGSPIALFYTTDRSSYRLSNKAPAIPRGRAAAYYGALRDKTINFGSFVAWFAAKQALARESSNARHLLKTVNIAIERFLPKFAKPTITKSPPRLFLRKGNVPLGIEQLSDGERSFLAMVVDISRHLAQANPTSKNPLDDGEGVVLIDELELHLHPKWQRAVVEQLQTTFPRLQFITTTHSPFVIQSLKQGQLIDFDPNTFDSEYSDKSIEDITETVMGVKMPQKSDRYQRMIATAEKYFRILRQANPQSADESQSIRRQLDALTEPFSDDPAYVALLRLERETTLGETEDAPR
jgi:predicted ATP-binding protein involved in virulence